MILNREVIDKIVEKKFEGLKSRLHWSKSWRIHVTAFPPKVETGIILRIFIGFIH